MATNSAATAPEVFDLWEHYQWKSPTATIEDHREKPWAHCEDAHKAYFGARFNKRSEFLDNLDPESRATIQRELKRIDRVRGRFSADTKKQPLVHSLTGSLREWRKCVGNNKAAMMDEIDEESQEKEYTSHRYERERATLQRCNPSVSPAHGAAASPVAMTGQSNRRSSLSMLMRRRERKISTQPRPESHSVAKEGADGLFDDPNEPDDFYGLKASAIKQHAMDRGKTRDYHPALLLLRVSILTHPLPKQKAIARYYNEKPEPLDDRHRTYSRKEKKTEKLLSREFWRGQMHGSSAYDSNPGSQLGNAPYSTEDWAKSRGPIHARHMRSRCALIPRDSSNRQHHRFSSAHTLREGEPLDGNSSIPDNAPSRNKDVAIFLPYIHWETGHRRDKMVQAIDQTIGRKKDPAFLDITMKTMETTDMSRTATKPKPWRRLLARYLFAVAQVAEQKDYEADERLLRDYVTADPPLHIRRTLDQYCFVNLDDTSKDQVVYRGTLDKRDSRTQSRVVMVDQLWLWILNNNTVITSFPRRWGRNKPDPSGVHKSLRERFEARPEDIRSAEHLALIIIDQCSRVFFDRTKPLDQRPEVMDIFASAIAHVDQMTAVASDTFWRHTKLYNKNMLPKTIGTKYLDINPEGALLKEAQDIAEELKMMKRIYNEQLKVVKDFKRHLHYPQGRRTEKADSAYQIQKLLLDLVSARDKPPHNNEDDRDEEDYDEESHDEVETLKHRQHQLVYQTQDDTLHEAEGVLELVKSRRAEIIELEQSAMHTCRQLEGFLTLKQQQASIVEAKAALHRAEESVKQGRAIMAFTVVTIFFLPLSFFAAFFGMNNDDINEAKWMTLDEQIKYMLSLSIVVGFLSTSIACYPSLRPYMVPIFKPFQTLYDTIADRSGATSRRREAKMALQEVQRRMDKREASLNRLPPSRQTQEAARSEKPGNTAGLTSVFAWLRKWKTTKAPNWGGNGFLPR
ncbi:hypothetical protein PG989_016283 [Apiospora arundinis]